MELSRAKRRSFDRAPVREFSREIARLDILISEAIVNKSVLGRNPATGRAAFLLLQIRALLV
jgi:hypothetical protein